MSQYIQTTQNQVGFEVSALSTKYIQEYFQAPAINGISIYTYEYTEIANSEVATQMIIDSSGSRLSYSDNIALSPKQWNIKGYLKGSPSEYTAYFMPSLQFQKTILYTFRQLRTQVFFKDPNQQVYQVFIENIEFPQLPDSMNVIPINVTLKEMNVLTSVLSQTDMVTSNAESPATNTAASSFNLGSPAGQVINIGADLASQGVNMVMTNLMNNYKPTDKKGNAV